MVAYLHVCFLGFCVHLQTVVGSSHVDVCADVVALHPENRRDRSLTHISTYYLVVSDRNLGGVRADIHTDVGLRT